MSLTSEFHPRQSESGRRNGGRTAELAGPVLRMLDILSHIPQGGLYALGVAVFSEVKTDHDTSLVPVYAPLVK